MAKRLNDKKRWPDRGHEYVSPYIYGGYACNNNCSFCSEADEYLKNLRNKSLEELKDEVKQVRAHYDFISLMGREPTLRPDFFKLLAFVKTLKFRQVSVATNGRLLSYPAFAKRMIACGVNQVGISFNSADEKTHDLMTQVPGSFKQTVQGIKNLMALRKPGLSILVNVPLTRHNYPTLELTLDLLIRLGVKEINILWVAPLSKRSRDKGVVCHMPTLSRYVAGVLQKNKYQKSPVKFLLVEFLPCSLPKTARDLFFPCLEKNSNKVRINLCAECPYKSSCDGILQDYLDLYGEKGLQI
ncbi:MAG: radical SAM protein [Patescibacteria group bacterium]|nr:radical SAM protein [Patescibacteria group bacterium]MCL5261988.1 radical SAM protein [Patescibacteria group bacterium]